MNKLNFTIIIYTFLLSACAGAPFTYDPSSTTGGSSTETGGSDSGSGGSTGGTISTGGVASTGGVSSGSAGAPTSTGGAPPVCVIKNKVDACGTKECGTVWDGCTGTVSCGECTSPEVCGGAGTPGMCGCTPLTKEVACGTHDCGNASNGCGGVIPCGTCTGNETCGGGATPVAGVCACTPKSKSEVCGTQVCGNAISNITAMLADTTESTKPIYSDDGCGNKVDCGECNTGTICGGYYDGQTTPGTVYLVSRHPGMCGGGEYQSPMIGSTNSCTALGKKYFTSMRYFSIDVVEEYGLNSVPGCDLVNQLANASGNIANAGYCCNW